MEICTAHPDHIAYVGRYCPACIEIEELKGEISSLLDTIEKLEAGWKTEEDKE